MVRGELFAAEPERASRAGSSHFSLGLEGVRPVTVSNAGGRVYVVATPIGNLEDLSPRARRVLAEEVALIACEDTRHTANLCQRFEIRTPRVSLHEHNEAARTRELLERLARGESIALVSDAGTPLVSDPGERLVRAAIGAGFAVVPIPGPSAVVAALVASGFAAQPFAFFGFLPRKGRERGARIAEIARFAGTALIYEAPARVAKTLADLHAALGARRVAICRELTKLHEEIVRGVLGELEVGELRGEVTLVIEAGDGPAEGTGADPDARAAELMAMGLSARDAAQALAGELGISRSDAYARINALRSR
jgi:16S rRNA (cytidine1402-2'-O)-methyltransferase